MSRSRAVTGAGLRSGDAGAPAGFTTSGQPATISTHLVRRPRRGLVDQAERVAEAPAELRLRVDAPADLVRDEDEREARAPWRRPPAGPPRPGGRSRISSGLLSSRFATQRLRQSTITTSASPSSAARADGERHAEPRRCARRGVAPPGGGRSGPPSRRPRPRRSRRTTTRPPSARARATANALFPARTPPRTRTVRGLTARWCGVSGWARSRAATRASLEDRFGVRGFQAGLLTLGSSYSPRPSRRAAPVGFVCGFRPRSQ